MRKLTLVPLPMVMSFRICSQSLRTRAEYYLSLSFEDRIAMWMQSAGA